MNVLKLATSLLRDGQVAWQLLRDPRVPTLMKLIPALAVLYVLSPLDLIPDWIPFIGGLDDIALVGGAISLFLSICNPDLVEEHRQSIEAD